MSKIIVFGITIVMLIVAIAESSVMVEQDKWMITYYCECKVCCGKSESHPAYGIMASGREVYVGAVACNVLALGTEIAIGNAVYTVEDRGARRLFDGKKHIDVYVSDHWVALQLGVQYSEVIIFN